jgi:hypothetical protein
MACDGEGGVGIVASGAQLTVNDWLPVLLQRRNRGIGTQLT